MLRSIGGIGGRQASLTPTWHIVLWEICCRSAMKKARPDEVLMEEISMLTEADESTINRLYEIWVSYDTDFDGTLSKDEFMSIPEVAASRCVIDYSICNFSSTQSGSDSISFSAFAILLSVMSIDGNLGKKIQYAFRVIDMNDDGKIDRDDLLQYMRLISRFDSVAVTEEKQEEYLNYAVDSTLNECGNGIFITLEMHRYVPLLNNAVVIFS